MKQMMKEILKMMCALLAVAGLWTPAEARTALDFFRATEAAIPLLDALTRLDMADYYAGGIDRASANSLGGEARLLGVSDSSVSLTTGTDMECRLDMFTAGADTVLMLTETYRLPQADSRITFYNTDWSARTRPEAPQPPLTDWLTPQGLLQRDDVERLLPFLMVEATADPAQGTLTLSHSMDSYFADAPDREALARWLRPSLTYRFNGKAFKPVR